MLPYEGITILAVGVGDADVKELNDIATDPDSKNVYKMKGYASLINITDQLRATICNPSE